MIKVRNVANNMQVSKWVIWIVFFLAIFSIGYLTTHLVVTAAMNDYEAEKSQRQ